jgi:hypothetical protein
MNSALSLAILVCTVPSMAAEAVSLVSPQTVLAMMPDDDGKSVTGPYQRLLMVASLFYMTALVLMVVCGDAIFQVSALAIVLLGSALWALRKHVLRRHWLLRLESTVCLVLLTNVLLTVLRMHGLLRI